MSKNRHLNVIPTPFLIGEREGKVMLFTEQKEKDECRAEVNSLEKSYDKIYDEFTKLITQYGTNYYDFKQGKLTSEYLNKCEDDTKESMSKTINDIVSNIVTNLKRIKDTYIANVYEGESTVDALELDFIRRELEVMSTDELKDFYDENITDKNKMRLLKVEIKRRKKESDNDVLVVENHVSGYEFQDVITSLLDEKIKFYTGIVQVRSVLTFFKEDVKGELHVRVINFDSLLEHAGAVSSFGRPNKDTVNIRDFVDRNNNF